MILSAIVDCGKKLNRNLHIEKNECAQTETNVEMWKFVNVKMPSAVSLPASFLFRLFIPFRLVNGVILPTETRNI